MKTLLVLSLLLLPAPQSQNLTVTPEDGSPLPVVAFKWTKTRQTIERQSEGRAAPIRAMTPADKNFERSRRVNDPVGVRDPNADTTDGRAAALEKNEQEARSPSKKHVDGFSYQAKVRNASTRVVEVVFWEYQFTETANPSNVTRRQFLCGVKIKPEKEKELTAFGVGGPIDVVSVQTLADKSANLFQERAVVNRVEYSDGTIWQRKGWNYAEVRASIQRAVSTPWGAEMCRAL